MKSYNFSMINLIALLFCLLVLISCSVQIPYEDVKAAFYKEYPDAKITKIAAESVPRLDSILGYSADIRITFKKKESSSDESVVWYYHYKNDYGKMVLVSKKSFEEYKKERSK